MNKKFMSLIVILITVITVFIMIYNSQNELNQNYNEKDINEYSAAKGQSNVNAKNNKKIAENKDNSNKRNDNQKNINITSNENNVDNNNSSDKQENNSSNTIAIVNNSNSNVNMDSNSKTSTSKSSNNDSSIKVFKVSKKDIVNELSFSDKLKLVSISKTLSPDDFNSLQDDINSRDEKKGVSKAMSLLKKRLDESDFNKVKFIASKYINLQAVEY